MSLNSSIAVRIRGTLVTAADLVTSSAPLTLDFNDELGSGVIADTADLIFSDTRTLAASGSEDLDLAGSLSMINGLAFTVVKLKLLFVSAAAGNTNDVVVSRPANGVPIFAASGDAHNIKPGGAMFLYAPTLAGICTVTAGTGDLIHIANSSGTTGVDYSIIIIGTSA